MSPSCVAVEQQPLCLRGPLNQQPLRPVAPGVLSDGDTFWPVVDGIPFLRTGRELLRAEVLAALKRGDRRLALAHLLRDQDDWARSPPPDLDQTLAVVDGVSAGTLGLRKAMEQLHFGPVAHYFSHRWSAPTFLSALGLLAQHWDSPPCVVEIACGIGQVLREVVQRGTAGVGVDVVFAKLWLAHHFVVPEAGLVCADATVALPMAPIAGSAVLCHDALYFLLEKRRVLSEMRRVASSSGRVLVGHAHNRLVDQRGIGGVPLTPEEYAALLPGAACYDDSDFVTAFLEGTPAPARAPMALGRAEALCFSASGGPALGSIDFGQPKPGARLKPNPLLVERNGLLQPFWPAPGLADEYACASYLGGHPSLSADLLARAASGLVDDEIALLARRRLLLDLPERW
ncbi:methyltransferase domain-containing protein [Stigmatella sp. ncwal1]|uniref:Methyltransferase domain-containing protein n=1 Tax=Stigmatella ashevillensis TaxID=2995309 RepID=A0ABT5D4L3_9BACT|nr:methyltransferase domain-containing protein [Stigmatella ashevillena]MDC0707994.1 methyltransferase domain-containing protein [Stigmatella ashevillena]